MFETLDGKLMEVINEVDNERCKLMASNKEDIVTLDQIDALQALMNTLQDARAMTANCLGSIAYYEPEEPVKYVPAITPGTE